MNGIKVLVLASLLVGCTVFGEKYSRAMNYNPIIDMVNRYGKCFCLSSSILSEKSLNLNCSCIKNKMFPEILNFQA